jgi:hypothetical protein
MISLNNPKKKKERSEKENVQRKYKRELTVPQTKSQNPQSAKQEKEYRKISK